MLRGLSFVVDTVAPAPLTPAQAAFVEALDSQEAAPTSGRAEIAIRMTGIDGENIEALGRELDDTGSATRMLPSSPGATKTCPTGGG